MNEAVGSQLRGFDAATWRTAAGDPTLRSTVVGLTLFDSAPDWTRLRARMDRLTRLMPVLRQRPLWGVTGLSAPRLAVDPDFDLDVHLRRYRLVAGAGWNDLLAEARRMSLTDFDHDRPLWQAALIEGLPGERAAFLIKLHHSIADGEATVMLGLILFELGPQPNPDEPPAPPPPAAEDASVGEVSMANVADNVRRLLAVASNSASTLGSLASGTIHDPVGTWTRTLNLLASMGRFTAVPDGPLSDVMTGRGTTYHFAAFDLPFKELHAAAKRDGHSVNDAFMAAVGSGMERYHRRFKSRVEDLRFNVPISTRGGPGDTSGRSANAVTIARFPLPIRDLTVDQRMDEAHEAVASWRHEPALGYADPLAAVSWLVPVPVLAHAAQASDVTTSNVPGPPIPLYLAGARMVGAYPLVATIGAAVNVTMVTYDGSAFIGISADDRAVVDLDAMVSDLRAGFAEVTGDPVGPADPFVTVKGEGVSKAVAVRRAEPARSSKSTRARSGAAKRTPAKASTAKAPANGAPGEPATRSRAAGTTTGD